MRIWELILTGRCRVHEGVIIILLSGVPADATYLLGMRTCCCKQAVQDADARALPSILIVARVEPCVHMQPTPHASCLPPPLPPFYWRVGAMVTPRVTGAGLLIMKKDLSVGLLSVDTMQHHVRVIQGIKYSGPPRQMD